MDALKQEWVDKTFDAILQVERYLGIKSEGSEDFARLANWIYHSKHNPHGFMPAGFESSKGSAQSFAYFLQILLHAMVDDGSLVFIETEIHGSFLVFGVDLDEEDKAIEITDKRYCATSRRPLELHDSVDRFIEHQEAYELYSVEGDERHAARMQSLELA